MDSRTRNVVGTSSPGNINKVTLTNLNSASRHDFFIVYEDNNYNPDYSIFYGMLESFAVK
jgi:kynureninase